MLTVYTGLDNQLLIWSKQTYVFKNIYNHSREINIKIKYANEFSKLGDS